MVDAGLAVVDKASIEGVVLRHAAVSARRDIAGILVVKAEEVGRRVWAGLEAVAVEEVGLAAMLRPQRMPTLWCRQDP